MTVLGEPHEDAREAAHAGVGPLAGVQAHARNKDFIVHLEEEERGPFFGSQLVLVFLHEGDYLRLSEAHRVSVLRYGAEYILERPVFVHLKDRKLSLLGLRGLHVGSPVGEVRVYPTSEYVVCAGDGVLGAGGNLDV